MVGREVSALKAKYAGFDDIKAKAGQVDDLTAKMAELQQQIEDAGKTAEQKERDRGEREMATLKAKLEAQTAQIAEYDGKVSAAEAAHRQTRASHMLATALSQADVYPDASADALSGMLANSDLDFNDETGALETLTLKINGTRYGSDKLKDAAAAFLETKPYFAKSAPGGTGTRLPTGGGGHSKPLHEMTSEERLLLDAAARRA